MRTKRTYFGYSTYQQRKLLFETWEEIGSVTEACRKARVSRGLFYYWKGRYEEKGAEGLAEFESRAAHKRRTISAAIRDQVVDMKKANPKWGKLRIAQEMAKANGWVKVVSPNTVRRVLQEAGWWEERKRGKKRAKGKRRRVRRVGRTNVERGCVFRARAA